jgi:hypothetical protein
MIKDVEVIPGKFQTIEEKLEVLRSKINEIVDAINGMFIIREEIKT